MLPVNLFNHAMPGRSDLLGLCTRQNVGVVAMKPFGGGRLLNKRGSLRVPKYQAMYQRIKSRKPPRKGHFVALVAIARDFVTNVLYDMWRYQRPFFLEVKDYRAYRKTHPRPAD